jgi:hypothetical protein
MPLSTTTKKALTIVGATLLGISLLLNLMLALNIRATMKAERFCTSISIGEPIANVVIRAKQENGITVAELSDSQVAFLVHGFVFAHASCVVEVDHGLVKSKGSHAATD